MAAITLATPKQINHRLKVFVLDSSTEEKHELGLLCKFEVAQTSALSITLTTLYGLAKEQCKKLWLAGQSVGKAAEVPMQFDYGNGFSHSGLFIVESGFKEPPMTNGLEKFTFKLVSTGTVWTEDIIPRRFYVKARGQRGGLHPVTLASYRIPMRFLAAHEPVFDPDGNETQVSHPMMFNFKITDAQNKAHAQLRSLELLETKLFNFKLIETANQSLGGQVLIKRLAQNEFRVCVYKIKKLRKA